jgi:UDP-3-O-[3-hydroxymyristoyl] glucosamine N-acyltransferase
MELSVKEIVEKIDAKIIGNDNFTVKGVSPFGDASSCDLTFAGDAKFLNNLLSTKAKVIIIPDTHIPDAGLKDKILLQVANPKISFFNMVSIFHPQKKIDPGIHPNADIGLNVKIGKNCIIQTNSFIGDGASIGNSVHLMPGVYIGEDVKIGDNTLIKPNVTIMEKSIIGKNVIVHSGTTIGSDGFGFAQSSEKHNKLIHAGHVLIGDDVEIGAGNTIDRGTLGTTLIGNGVKTDNLVHIAHNVKVGDNTLLVAQVGIAGSAQIGSNVIIAGKAGISGHIKIGNGSIVGPFSGVHSSVPENQIVSGVPHMPHKNWRKVVSIISRLPQMRKNLFSLEKRLKILEQKSDNGV